MPGADDSAQLPALKVSGFGVPSGFGRVRQAVAHFLSSSSPPPALPSDAATLPTSVVEDDALDRRSEDLASEHIGQAADEDIFVDDVEEQPQTIFDVPDNEGPARVIARLERILGDIEDAILRGRVLSIPLATRVSRRRRQAAGNMPVDQDDAEDDPDAPAAPGQTVVRFPGRNAAETRKFAQVQKIIQHAHRALIGGFVLSKRNIYYQDQWLFGTQAVVDNLVDDLAFTLRIGRDDLNIVAAGKGMICGHLRFLERGPRAQWSDCKSGYDSGVLVPPLRTLRKLDMGEAQWILVIEKEATFRTLSARRYWDNSRLGSGILVTGKGYADLATRQLLNYIHSVRPDIPMFALVDYDPHGIRILRTFMYGSLRLGHEENITVPSIRWLGIRGHHFLTFDNQDIKEEDDSQAMGDGSSQLGSSGSYGSSSPGYDLRPRKRPRHETKNMQQSAMPLTTSDRKTATKLLEVIHDQDVWSPAEEDQVQQLQMMLMLNVKAEIQAVDSYGDLSGWLDQNLHLE